MQALGKYMTIRYLDPWGRVVILGNQRSQKNGLPEALRHVYLADPVDAIHRKKGI